MTINANLYAHFQQAFPLDLDSQLLLTEDGRSISYAQADEVSARIANGLLRLGAIPGDRVTVQVEKSTESLFLYLACLRAGLVYHPLNTAYKKSELEFFLDNAEPTVVICASSSLKTIQNLVSKRQVKAVLTLDTDGSGSLIELALEADCEHIIAQNKGSDDAALLYSSGTTGRPKGILLTHDNLHSNALTLIEAWGFNAHDCLLHMLPIYHVHGLFVAVHCVLLSGARMKWYRRFEAAAAIEALPTCTVMMGVPTYYTRMLTDTRFDAACCSNMRLFTSGSAPLLSETFVKFEQRTGHKILERYGMTETGMNTSNPLHGERRPGTVGTPLSGVTVRVVDDSNIAVKAGEAGNLQVKGPNVFLGYWRLPEKTPEDFTDDGFFNTGDQASIDTDGYVSIVGRTKDMVITGGLNVYPKEIEQVIDGIDGVRESAVIGIADDDFGEAVVAVAVPDGTPPNETELIQICRAELANFKVPKQIKFVNELPRNAMGKVQKNVLRERFSKLSTGEN